MASPMKAQDFVAKIKAWVGSGYWYGTFASMVSSEALLAQKAKQFPQQYTPTNIATSRRWLDGDKFVPPPGYLKLPNAPAGTPVMDCVGLIKGTIWIANGLKYEAASDLSADGWFAKSTIKGPIATIPEKPGLVVHKPSHIGVYIGGGLVVESRGGNYGVVITKLAERGFTEWGESYLVDYTEVPVINWEAEAKALAEQVARLNIALKQSNDKYDALKVIVDEYNAASRKLLEV